MFRNLIIICFLVLQTIKITGQSPDNIPWLVNDNNRNTVFFKLGVGMDFGNHNQRYYIISEANLIFNNRMKWTRDGNDFINCPMRQKLGLLNRFYFNWKIFNNSFEPFSKTNESYSIVTTLTTNLSFFGNKSIYGNDVKDVLDSDAWKRSGLDIELGMLNTIHTDALRKLSNLQFILGLGMVNKSDLYHLGFRFIEDIILIPQLVELSHDHGETTTWNIFANFRSKPLKFRESTSFGLQWTTKMITDRRDRLDLVRPHPKHSNGLYNTLMTRHPEHGNRTLNIFHHYRTLTASLQGNYHSAGFTIGTDNLRYGMKEQRWGHQGQQHKRRSTRTSFWGKHKSPTVESALFPWLNVERYFTKKPWVFELHYALTSFNATKI